MAAENFRTDAGAQKVVQYLEEAHAAEVALVRVLQEQVALAPRGRLRDGLETHLRETRDHAQRVRARSRALGRAGNPLALAYGIVQTVAGQALSLGKTPLDLLRGTGGEEKVLKNVKDACATEALEIATYTALGRVAEDVGDTETAELARSIRADEERMLERLLGEIPTLADRVVGAEVDGNPSFDPTRTGAADAARKGARAARKVPGGKSIAGDEPWPGYDDLNAADVASALRSSDEETIEAARRYERSHKKRSSVLEVADSKLAAT